MSEVLSKSISDELEASGLSSSKPVFFNDGQQMAVEETTGGSMVPTPGTMTPAAGTPAGGSPQVSRPPSRQQSAAPAARLSASEASFGHQSIRSTATNNPGDGPPLHPSDSVDLSTSLTRPQTGSKGLAMKLPAHLLKQEKELEEIRKLKGGPKAGTVGNAFASAASAVDSAQLGHVDKRSGFEIPSPLQLFRAYDKDLSGAITEDEFSNMLFELNGLDEVVLEDGQSEAYKRKRDAHARKTFQKWDLNNDGMISLDEFYLYFYTEACFKFPLLRTGINPGADLSNVFEKYACKSAPMFELGIIQFNKLCRDCKLLNGTTVTSAIVDLVYTRSRAELEGLEDYRPNSYATNKMLYPQFLFALQLIANKRQTGFQEVVARILSNVSAKPKAKMADLLIFRSNGTEAEKEEFLERPDGLPPNHSFNNDMTSRLQKESELAKQYGLPNHAGKPSGGSLGGASGRGGAGGENEPPTPSLTVVPPAGDFIAPEEEESNLPDYSRVVDKGQLKQWGLRASTVALPKSGPSAVEDPHSMIATRQLTQDELLMGLKKVFESYNLWDQGVNKGAMDKTRFMKLWRDARMVNEGPTGFGLPTTVLCKIWDKVLPTAKSTLNFPMFVDTLRHVATLLRTSLNEIMERIVIVSKPQ